MPDTAGKPRRPLLALLLSLPMPGLGHLYTGNLQQGFRFFLFYFFSSHLLTLTWAYLLTTPEILKGFLILFLSIYIFICIHAYLQAKKGPSKTKLKWYSRWYGLMMILFGWIFIIVTLKPTEIYFQRFNILGGSMNPAVMEKDFIAVKNAAYRIAIPGTGHTLIRLRTPERGDIIVFKNPEDESWIMIQRVVGLPGEIIEIRNHHVLINEAPLSEPHADKDTQGNDSTRNNLAPITIPSDAYFVLGDHRARSLDSRYFGPVLFDKIIGKVFWILWSHDEETGQLRWDRIGKIDP